VGNPQAVVVGAQAVVAQAVVLLLLLQLVVGVVAVVVVEPVEMPNVPVWLGLLLMFSHWRGQFERTLLPQRTGFVTWMTLKMLSTILRMRTLTPVTTIQMLRTQRMSGAPRRSRRVLFHIRGRVVPRKDCLVRQMRNWRRTLRLGAAVPYSGVKCLCLIVSCTVP